VPPRRAGGSHGQNGAKAAGVNGANGTRRAARPTRGATGRPAVAVADEDVDGEDSEAGPLDAVEVVEPAEVEGGTDVEDGVVPVEEPRAVPATASATRAAASGAEPTLREWLNQRWLFGLSYWQAIVIALLLAAVIPTRFYALGDRAMHHDESMHAKFAWDTFHGQVYKYNPLLHGPFQFLAVATSFWLFGATEWTARLVPATFGVVLIGLTFLWRRWLGTMGLIFALAIFIFSPSFTYFARMLREDSYTATWTLLAATGLVGYVLHRTRRWYYAFCAGLAFAFCTKESTYITAFIFGTFMILSVLWEHVNTMQRRVLAGLAAGGVLGAYYSMVMDQPLFGLHKQALHEVGGAVIGAAIGALAGFVYHQFRPAPAAPVAPAANGARATPAVPPRLRRRAAQDNALDRPGSRGVPRQRLAGDGLMTRAFRTLWGDTDGFWGLGTFWGGVVIFTVIFVLFFTSFFTNPGGLREGLIGSIQYWLDQHGVQRGNQPWFYYLLLLGAYETLPWVFGIVATVYYLRKPTWLTTFLIWWAACGLTIYSWAGEKMPWLIIHIAMPMVLLSARYLGELATSATRGLWEKRIAFSALAVLGIWTIHTGWPVNFERPDTPRDLLVYTQTAPDVKKVMADIQRMSLEQTGDAYGIGVTVQSGTWWPFSWYLRDFKNVDYPSQLTAPATKPIVLIALEDDEKNRPFLQGYTRTKYKMRWWYPEDYRNLKASSIVDVFTKKDVRDGLWKWLIYRETTQPLGSYDFYVYLKEGLGGAGASAGTAGAVDAAPPVAVQQAQRANAEQYAAKTVPLSPLAQWGSNGRNTGQFNTPRGLALDGQGNLYVADTENNRVQKFDSTGKLLTAWGTEGAGDGQFKQPMGVVVDPQGNVYVADTWNHRVQKFDATGKFLLKWSGQGGFWGPRDVKLDAQGNVYVVDTGNKRIQKFDSSGKFIALIGTGGSGPGQLNEPIGLAISPAGDVYVADTNNKRIQKFDAGGKFVAEWPVAGWQQSARTEPYLALDPAGNLYVTDPGNARIIKFGPDGEVLGVAGGLGKGPNQLDLPLGVAVADNAVYAADSNNHRIAVFAPLP
jgi:predicted membrane-bound mannosyltransferase/sugar lactone lactonase YvrE